MVRDSSTNDASSVKPIEIPPPRPKRKPLHPYPRKLVASLKAGTLVAEGPRRSPSPILLASEQENRSPTSVLSGIGSEILGTPDSSTPSGSPSQGSSAADMSPGVSLHSDPNSSPDVTGSPLLVQLSAPDEQVPMVLVLSVLSCLYPYNNVNIFCILTSLFFHLFLCTMSRNWSYVHMTVTLFKKGQLRQHLLGV